MPTARELRARRASGFTILELVLTLALLGSVAGGVAMLGVSSQGLYEQSSLTERLEMKAVRALDRVLREISMLQATGMLPNPATPFGTEDLTCQVAIGVTAGSVDWSPPLQVVLEYDPGEVNDGVDNDGDGLADEGRVLLVRNAGLAGETRTVLCTGVREYLEGETFNGADDNGNGVRDERGFNLHRAGDLMTVRLSLVAASRGGRQVVRTVETSFRLRN